MHSGGCADARAAGAKPAFTTTTKTLVHHRSVVLEPHGTGPPRLTAPVVVAHIASVGAVSEQVGLGTSGHPSVLGVALHLHVPNIRRSVSDRRLLQPAGRTEPPDRVIRARRPRLPRGELRQRGHVREVGRSEAAQRCPGRRAGSPARRRWPSPRGGRAGRPGRSPSRTAPVRGPCPAPDLFQLPAHPTDGVGGMTTVQLRAGLVGSGWRRPNRGLAVLAELTMSSSSQSP